ncbi:MAG: hypothetical protein PHE67_03240 [Campylobacterales bacterium]|nr:hypothetical protein [Campylobacterales bacterium]
MQKRFLSLAFIGLLSTSAFATSDLLSQATDGAVKTTEAKALSNDEMKDVKGAGWKAPIYAAAFSYPAQNRAMSTLASNVRVKGIGGW